jgi:Protein of unknown function (DUF1570)
VPQGTLPDLPACSGARRGMHLRSTLLVLLAAVVSHGCATPRRDIARLPREYVARGNEFQVRSDTELSNDDPLMAELNELRTQVRQKLELPEQKRPVVVYLFADEHRYDQYMASKYPELPPRRAFFIGTPGELSVYAYLGDQVREDLRHEYTHGLLHSSLRTVPLWLDEGLAEYFEVSRAQPDRINISHARGLAQMIESGWQPNLHRLEQLEDVSEMQRADYQEAWAWVHYLLHDSDDTRQLLISYLTDLTSTAQPGSFAARIEAEIPQPEQRLRSYITSLTTDVGRAHVTLATPDR